VADKQLVKLLQNDKFLLPNYADQNSYTRASKFVNDGYIKEELKANPYKGGGNIEPKEYQKDQEKYFSNFFKKINQQ
jgi:hypothetical protein